VGEYTRLRADLVHDRTRYWARLEKLLERALIKVSDVASGLRIPGRILASIDC
jgi:transposase